MTDKTSHITARKLVTTQYQHYCCELRQTKDLTPEQKLLLAVIRQAVKDQQPDHADTRDKEKARQRREEAAAFFSSPLYREYLSAIGLPETWLPTELRTSPKRP